MRLFKKYYGFIIFICLSIVLITLEVIYLVKIYNKRTNYDELTYYDFDIDYDDDNSCYGIFTNDKIYTIRESELDIKCDDETYIVIFDNNYDWFYNKAILFIGVGEQRNDK